MSAIRSTDATPKEQALGHFTRQKLKTLDDWDQWLAGKQKQLDQFHKLGVFSKPCEMLRYLRTKDPGKNSLESLMIPDSITLGTGISSIKQDSLEIGIKNIFSKNTY